MALFLDHGDLCMGQRDEIAGVDGQIAESAFMYEDALQKPAMPLYGQSGFQEKSYDLETCY